MIKLGNLMRLVPTAGCALIAAGLTVMAVRPAAAATPLTLKEAVQRAVAFAPSVEAADAQSDLGSAMLQAARAPLYPSISAVSEYGQFPGYSLTIANGGLSEAMLTLNYTAFDFGRRAAAARAALYQREADQYGVGVARTQIIFDTTAAYYTLLSAQKTENELASSARRIGRYVKVIEALQRSGRAIANDVLKIRTAHDASLIALSNARHSTQRASATLGALMGDMGPSDISVAAVNGVPRWPGNNLARNPILEATQRQIASTQAAVLAAQRERYPTVKLALTAGWQGVNPPHTFTHDGGASYDGLVSMPIFDGGLISAHIDAARARELAAKARLRQVKLDLRRRLTEAKLRYKAARDQLSLLQRALPTAKADFALAWARFLGGGHVTLLEVLSAYQQAEQLRLQHFAERRAAREAVAEAVLLTGTAE